MSNESKKENVAKRKRKKIIILRTRATILTQLWFTPSSSALPRKRRRKNSFITSIPGYNVPLVIKLVHTVPFCSPHPFTLFLRCLPFCMPSPRGKERHFHTTYASIRGKKKKRSPTHMHLFLECILRVIIVTRNVMSIMSINYLLTKDHAKTKSAKKTDTFGFINCYLPPKKRKHGSSHDPRLGMLARHTHACHSHSSTVLCSFVSVWLKRVFL